MARVTVQMGGRMADITELIRRDHEWFRERFAALDELRGQDGVDPERLKEVWGPLADRLDVHAIAEEEIFYPQLLARGENPEDETLDAIGDHNDIRDATHAANRAQVGSEQWWAAVDDARIANDEHMAEEEREGLADFTQNAPSGLRESLGTRFQEFMANQRASTLDTEDKDPTTYVRETEREVGVGPDGTRDHSLGIGSLKGRSR
jgi:hypothetical protein